ncbi:putative necrosis-inducing factor-domain-containing protein, partial [Cladorrhinum sp. PSN259]
MPEYAQYKCNGVWYVPGPLPKEPNSTLSSEARDCVDWSISSKDENSDASPLKSDCEVMYNNIAGEGSWYLPWSYVQRTFITYGTCAFGGTDITPGTEAWVGNDDIRKVLEWAFDSHTGKNSNGDEIVSGSGDMQCQPWGGRVTWGLYHS